MAEQFETGIDHSQTDAYSPTPLYVLAAEKFHRLSLLADGNRHLLDAPTATVETHLQTHEPLEFEGMFPAKAVPGAIENVTELVVRSYTAEARRLVAQAVLEDAELVEQDPIFAEMQVTPQGELTFRGARANIKDHLFFELPQDREMTHADFLREVHRRFAQTNPYQVEANTFESEPTLMGELATFDRLVHNTMRILQAKQRVLETYLVQQAGVRATLQREFRDETNLLFMPEEASNEIKRALASDQDAYHFAAMALIRDNRGYYREDEKKYGDTYLNAGAKAARALQYAKGAHRDVVERIDTYEPDYGSEAFHGVSQAYDGMSYALPIDSIKHFPDAIRNIWESPIRGGDIMNNLKRRQQQGDTHPTHPVFVKVSYPFRANFTFYGQMIDDQPHLGLRISYGDMETKGTEKDPYKANLKEGFEYTNK